MLPGLGKVGVNRGCGFLGILVVQGHMPVGQITDK